MGQTQGRELPYDIGEKFTSLSSKTIWSVHAGKKKTSGEPVTVFVFDFAERSQEEIKLAQSAHLRLKTLRHPNILKYVDGIELPTSIYVVTEEALPLDEYITTKDGSSNFSISWGLHQIIKSIGFLTNDCGLVHHNVCLSSVFVDEAGEWKLAGVEFMHPYGDTSMPPKNFGQLGKYDPPETSKPGAAKRTSKWSTDVWGLGCLVWEIFNGPLPQTSALKNTSKIPKPLITHYCEMVSANPKSRPNPSVLLSNLREHGGFLANNFVSIALRIEEVQIMEPTQRNDFFNELNKNLDSFPESFAKHKILPQLINAFEFGGAGSSVLSPLFKLGGLLKSEQYQKKIVPCVVKLFSSTDRATRLNLLKQLEHFIDHLLPATVNDQIFPSIANGFTDTVAALREQTVKATVLIAPKLKSSTLNGQLLKYLAKCQLDEEPAIRTNTNICLGKIAGYLSPSTRQKVLVTAFLRALKDPFPPARIAAIGSMGATQGFFSTSDLSSRIMPALCIVTIDKEKAVRDIAFKTIKLFLAKLEKLSEDPKAAAQQEKIEASTNSWTGWAMSSLTSKFYKNPRSQATPTSNVPVTKESVEDRQKKAVGGGPTSSSKEDETLRAGGGGKQDLEPSHKVESNADDGWGNDEWKDFGVSGQESREPEVSASMGWGSGEVEAKEDSDMEGWEDDGWGTFDIPDTKPSQHQKQQQHSPEKSSGADFFDTFDTASSQRTKTKDFFDSYGISNPRPSPLKKEKSPPPLTSASLFGGSNTGSKVGTGIGGVAASDTGDGGGWGDWSEDFDMKPAMQVQAAENIGLKLGSKAKEPEQLSTATGDGWGLDDSSWGTFDDQPKSAVNDEKSRQEELQKKREERRLKQQAAREKRAAGTALKPSGLGAVKKD